MARRRPLHLPRLRGVRAVARRGTRRAAPRAGVAARRGAPPRPRRGVGHVRAHGAGAAPPRLRALRAHAHQGAGALHRPPRGAVRLRGREALRRRRHGGRRVPLHRALHRERVQRVHRRRAGAAPQGRARDRARRARPARSRRPHARAHPRDLPARRVVPPLERRAVRRRHRHPAHGRAAQAAPVRVARRVRPLRVVPRVPAARPLHDDRARADPRRAARGVRRSRRSGRRRRLPGVGHRVGAGAAAHRGVHTRRAHAGPTSPSSRSASGAWRATGSTTCATRSSPRTARRWGSTPSGSGPTPFPPGYQFEVPATVAVTDLAVLEGLDPAGDLAVRLDRARPLRPATATRCGPSSTAPVARWCCPT